MVGQMERYFGMFTTMPFKTSKSFSHKADGNLIIFLWNSYYQLSQDFPVLAFDDVSLSADVAF